MMRDHMPQPQHNYPTPLPQYVPLDDYKNALWWNKVACVVCTTLGAVLGAGGMYLWLM